jgi:50S ribosomal protein L16 3-hydroxylase
MTTIFDHSALSPKEFLRDYWQRKPLLLRQAFPGFEPELDADDIAGLACDDTAESRLITGRYPGRQWSLRYGPFSEADFATLPDCDWTLLVQDVEKHYPPLRRLLAAFDFLPRWRIDDLMVSVAGPGGSVGPHVDQYDVFLLQAGGQRRWQIAERFDPELEPDCDLKVLRRFVAEQEWILEPGDVLYLPPGVAHFGTAVAATAANARSHISPCMTPSMTPCMTWSIGMRAPSTADLLQSFGEWLAESEDEGGRYRDPDLEPASRAGEIDPAALRRLRDLARACIDDDSRCPAFLGAFLSRYRLAHEPAPPPAAIGPDELWRALDRGAKLRHNPWTRLLWLRTRDGALLFAAGSAFACEPDLAEAVCDPEGLDGSTAQRLAARRPGEAEGLLCELLNRGHLLLETV